MKHSTGSSPRTRGQTSLLTAARRRQYVDDLIDDYVSWRGACGAVATSYENWSCATRQDRALAFSAYLAALSREEKAATSYQLAVEELAGSVPSRGG